MTAPLGTTLPRVLLLLTLGFGLSACDQNTQDSNTPTKESNITPPITLAEPALAEALQHYQHAKTHALRAISSCMEELSTDIEHFLASPTQPLLNKNQQALQHCLDLYIPIHTLVRSNSNQALQALITPLITSVYSTPILPGYVDYLLQYPNSGIVNDITLALSEQSLRDQQGLTDNGEVSIGFEVIAFILMGEQRYNQSLAPRPAIDFEEPHANRRRQYLTFAVSLLRQDLMELQALLESAAVRIPQGDQQTAHLTGQDNNALEQSIALQTTRNILNTMLVNIEQQSLDSLSMGYWELLRYSEPHSETIERNNGNNTGSTLASYLKWPQETPDLSREAFTAQLKASLQRLQ
ncbi:hypothetical protein A9Q81_07925 [Gammaproteobacteria bacterium 42_54_T18]|nr:hypothetical protein A9Q81_07925 [Gammaproteobacteria bacterium 42_54_T18]